MSKNIEKFNKPGFKIKIIYSRLSIPYIPIFKRKLMLKSFKKIKFNQINNM